MVFWAVTLLYDVLGYQGLHSEDGRSRLLLNPGILPHHYIQYHNPENHDFNLHCHENLNIKTDGCEWLLDNDVRGKSWPADSHTV